MSLYCIHRTDVTVGDQSDNLCCKYMMEHRLFEKIKFNMLWCVCSGVLFFLDTFSWHAQYINDIFGIKLSKNDQIFFCLFFQTVMIIIGDQPAISRVSVRMELCVILWKEPVSVVQGLLGSTVRTCVQPGTLGKVVCRGANVGLEDPVIKQLENVYVGMDSLGPCKCITSLHEWKKNYQFF